jgi:hypothetical protein
VQEINPLIDVVLHEERLDSTNVMEVFAQYDLIVDGTDNFATRYMVNDAAFFLGKPYVWGSIYRFDGQASVFWPTAPGGEAPCYRCLYPEPPPPGMVPSCAEGGVLGVLCASIGSIQTTEAVKLLTGIGEPLVGSLMVYDALDMEYRKIRVRKDPECPLCGKNPTITGSSTTRPSAASCRRRRRRPPPAARSSRPSSRRRWTAARTSCSSTSASRRSTRSCRSRARCSSPRATSSTARRWRSCRRTRRSSCTARAACAPPRRSRRSRPPG